MIAYEASHWSDLFVAAAGAAAALAGLVFVAVSINLDRILEFRGLPERAMETLLLLVTVLIVAIVGLIPGQGHVAFGVELLVLALGLGAALFLTVTNSLPDADQPRSRLFSRVVVLAFGAVPFVVGAVSILAQSGGGLYWIVAGILFAIGGAVANAWVLLVEIKR